MSDNRYLIDEDVLAWEKWRPQYFRKNDSKLCKVAILLFLRSEFRAQFMFRLGTWKRFILRPIVFGEANSCYIENGANIGGGLVVLHGNGVVIGGGARIGRNCTIFQNSTIGNHNGFPEIGDNCFIGAGAIVIGPIKIGNNVKIGGGLLWWKMFQIIALSYVRKQG